MSARFCVATSSLPPTSHNTRIMNIAEKESRSPFPKELAAVWLCVAVVWGGNLWVQRAHFERDVDAYIEFARNVNETGVFARTLPSGERCPSAFRPPLYPLLLSALSGFGSVSAWQIAILHFLCGIGIATLVYRLGRRVDRRVGTLAAMFVAFDPLLLYWSTYPMTETIAALLALIVIELGVCWHDVFSQSKGVFHGARADFRPSGISPGYLAAFWGASLGLATLCRPVFLVWGLILAGWIINHAPRRLAVRQASILLVGCAIVLAPWAWRNARMVGRATPLTTHGGYTLLLANNPAYYQHLRKGRRREVWDAKQLAPLLDNVGIVVPDKCEPFEVAHDRQCRNLAFDTIFSQPFMFAFASFTRVVELWSPLPHKTTFIESRKRWAARYLIACWYLLIYGAAGYGMVRAKDDRSLLLVHIGLAGAVAFTLVHLVYFSNMRMRAPLMPWLCLVAAIGVFQLLDAIRTRKDIIVAEVIES